MASTLSALLPGLVVDHLATFLFLLLRRLTQRFSKGVPAILEGAQGFTRLASQPGDPLDRNANGPGEFLRSGLDLVVQAAGESENRSFGRLPILFLQI